MSETASLLIPMSSVVCKWCGAPFSVPSAVFDRDRTALLCPSGHSHYQNLSIQDRLSAARVENDVLEERIAGLLRQVTSLRGAITRMKKKAP